MTTLTHIETQLGVIYKLYLESEEESPSNPFTDRSIYEEFVAKIRLKAQTNPWTWFRAKVVAEFVGFNGHAYLGCCSYRTKEDFLAENWKDLTETALVDLRAEIQRAIKLGVEADLLMKLITPQPPTHGELVIALEAICKNFIASDAECVEKARQILVRANTLYHPQD